MATPHSNKSFPNGIMLPDPQIIEKAPRRTLSATYKLHIPKKLMPVLSLGRLALYYAVKDSMHPN
jgi:hypothetical protein